jgi:sugar phosphate isomerase/epimerase
MKPAVVLCGPDMAQGPLALLSGTFAERIDKAASLGYRGIELMVRDPAAIDVEWLREALHRTGMEMPQIVTGELFAADGLALVHRDPQLRKRSNERARAVIDLAASLEAMVNLGRFRGRLADLGPVADPWALALEQLRPVLQYAGEQGVRLTLEPLNRYESDYLHTAAEARRLIEASGSQQLGLMLDLFHMNIEETSFADGFRAAGDHMWHVHIADTNRRYPGSGHLDFAAVFEILRTIGYRGFVSAELLPLPDPDTAAAKTIQVLKKLLVKT